MQGSSFILLDAMIIIEAHARGVWASLVKRTHLVVPSIVIQEARYYFDPDNETDVRIDLTPLIEAGTLQVVSATPDQIDQVHARLDSVFLETIHAGETEALALLLGGDLADCKFCTAEARATQALALLDMRDAAISLESVLRGVGLHPKLRHHYTDKFIREHLDKGTEMRIRGEGLRKLDAPHTARKRGKKNRP